MAVNASIAFRWYKHNDDENCNEKRKQTFIPPFVVQQYSTTNRGKTRSFISWCWYK